MKLFKYILAGIGLVSLVGCTDLTETPYSFIPGNKFYQSRENVMQSFVRPFGSAYWCTTQMPFQFSEVSADQYMVCQQESDWTEPPFFKLHYHEWDLDHWMVERYWEDFYRTIALCNQPIYDFQHLDLEKLGLQQSEIDNFIAQHRILRAYLFMMLFDVFHNIPIVTDPLQTDLPIQSSPEETFNFIEKEIHEAMPLLLKKDWTGGNKIEQGVWTQGAAAALLARLYMNASWWIGKDMSNECETLCQNIIDGKYGTYELATRWDAPFDWNNETCDEVIYAFPCTFGGAHWHYDWWSGHWANMPWLASYYFNFFDWGKWMGSKYKLQPGIDLKGEEYTFNKIDDIELGKPVLKFKKYPDDLRLKKYKNIGLGQREGMFLYGELEYEESGEAKYLWESNGGYQLYIRDQVGIFRNTPADEMTPRPIDGKETNISDIRHGDQNSGWFVIKYPVFSSEDGHKIEADYVIFRLAEIYYNLAEIKLKKGDKVAAEKLLNKVRMKNYPIGSKSLYPEDGSVICNQEMVDEWGREFIGEGLRRQILSRYGMYTKGSWWDKNPDIDDHYQWLPLPRTALQTNKNLKQNPGYAGI